MCICSDSNINLEKFCILNDDVITGNDSNLLVIGKNNILFSCMKCISDWI